jgi:hypothetical protein
MPQSVDAAEFLPDALLLRSATVMGYGAAGSAFTANATSAVAAVAATAPDTASAAAVTAAGAAAAAAMAAAADPTAGGLVARLDPSALLPTLLHCAGGAEGLADVMASPAAALAATARAAGITNGARAQTSSSHKLVRQARQTSSSRAHRLRVLCPSSCRVLPT